MAQPRLSTPSQDPCYLQEKLPAELRNEIYELVFTTGTPESTQGNGPATVDLFHATPPSKALTLTCRQFHAEAHDMYKTAYQSYWKTTSFTVNGNSMTRNAISRLRVQGLQHITKLKATGTTPSGTTVILELLSVDSVWRYTEISNAWMSEHYHVLAAPARSRRYKSFRTETEAARFSATIQYKRTLKEQLKDVKGAYVP
ncbi:hypothetical protein HII31_10196 [Pseudocercospora fuligena]|uniref:Uncharacterized protein n=1 Tax=Pseudocercospora fuligena TaxID=685502 RepID=A0A8H6VHQ9_9PEZI|nr:hypothetical protein HII31_10196 [Pseudocercospora fuligena]